MSLFQKVRQKIAALATRVADKLSGAKARRQAVEQYIRNRMASAIPAGGRMVHLSRLQGEYHSPLRQHRTGVAKLWLEVMGRPMTGRQWVQVRKAERRGTTVGTARAVAVFFRKLRDTEGT